MKFHEIPVTDLVADRHMDGHCMHYWLSIFLQKERLKNCSCWGSLKGGVLAGSSRLHSVGCEVCRQDNLCSVLSSKRQTEGKWL